MLATSVSLAMLVVIGLGMPSCDWVGMALRATARWSFLWFSLASTGGALCALFGSRFHPRTGGGISNLVIYLPLPAMAIAGPFLRLAASVKRRAQGQRVAA